MQKTVATSLTTRVLIAMLGLVFLASCSTLLSRNGAKETRSSSLVDYLYPNGNNRPEHTAEIPVLKLPVKAGIAFVPSNNRHQNGVSEHDQLELLRKVKNSFLQYDYIDRIEVIPSTYLKSGKGFSTLEQVARLYDVEVMALVSYDQISQTFENNAALFYWTIIGLYVVPGNNNTVQTFVDTAVFDLKSRKMLFRAPGISKQGNISTAAGIDKARSRRSIKGFDAAVEDMTVNLDAELARFKTRVKEEKIAKVQRREGYTGGGSLGLFSVVCLFLLLIKSVFNFKSSGRQLSLRPLKFMNRSSGIETQNSSPTISVNVPDSSTYKIRQRSHEPTFSVSSTRHASSAPSSTH